MNLQIFKALERNSRIINTNVLFNTSLMNNVRADGTNTLFWLMAKNKEVLFKVEAQYDTVLQSIIDYNFGVTIQVTITQIGMREINSIQQLQIDKIFYGYADPDAPSYSILYYDGGSSSTKYKVQASLTELQSLGNLIPEKFYMTTGQTSITTTRQLPDDVIIYLNGSCQGLVSELSDWEITGIKTLTYSGLEFFGGEEIQIVRI